MKSFLFALTLTLMAPFAHATDPSHLDFSRGLHANCMWTEGPQSPAESKLFIEWATGNDQTPIDPGAFVVELFMPEMGHGSAPTQIQRVLSKSGTPLLGQYEVSNMYFVMGGKWQVKVTLTYADGAKETQEFDVDVPGPMMNHGHHH